jgi:hypothetical protein
MAPRWARRRSPLPRRRSASIRTRPSSGRRGDHTHSQADRAWVRRLSRSGSRLTTTGQRPMLTARRCTSG